MSARSALIGQTVGRGRLRVERFIGAGTTGEVFEGVATNGARVAIKFLNDRFANDPTFRGRFLREAQIAVEVDSPYVARIVMAGEHKSRPWIAFEFLEGEALDARLRRTKTLPLEETQWVVEHVFEALRAAHSVRVVHRDIKPANVFLEASRRRARILDFGISKAESAGADTSSRTETDTILGTVEYMSPEQLRNARDVDARTDLYATGVVAFRAMTGTLPFKGRSKMALIAFKYERTPVSLGAATGTAWPEVFEVFFRSILAIDPAMRPASATDALKRWRELFASAAYVESLDAAQGYTTEPITDTGPSSSRRGAR